jgi:hypothetical protein
MSGRILEGLDAIRDATNGIGSVLESSLGTIVEP